MSATGSAAAGITPDLTVLELIHAALRRDLARLVAAMESTVPLDDDRVTAWRGQWELFARELHGHHTAEDRLVWPVLQQRAGAAAQDVLAAMTAEHAAIDPLLAEVGQQVERLVVQPVPARRQELAGALRQAAEQLQAHLAHEERAAIPLVCIHLTQEDLDRVGAVQRREQGLRGASRFLPWILEGAPTAKREHVLAELPPLFRLLVRRWQRGHDRAVARAFGPPPRR